MTIEECSILRRELSERVKKELTPSDCPFCGGVHLVSFSRHDAMPIFSNHCCNDMMREIYRIKREVFGDQNV